MYYVYDRKKQTCSKWFFTPQTDCVVLSVVCCCLDVERDLLFLNYPAPFQSPAPVILLQWQKKHIYWERTGRGRAMALFSCAHWGGASGFTFCVGLRVSSCTMSSCLPYLRCSGESHMFKRYTHTFTMLPKNTWYGSVSSVSYHCCKVFVHGRFSICSLTMINNEVQCRPAKLISLENFCCEVML